MRVALQISGQQRYGEYWPEFLKCFSLVDCDVFIHNWDGPRSHRQLEVIAPNVKTVVTEPQKIFHPKKEWTLLHPQGSSIFNLMSMTYGMQRVNRMRLEYEYTTGIEYDVVIRARSDIKLWGWRHMFVVPENTVQVGDRPDYLPVGKKEMQDQIAMGRPDVMNYYSDMYDGFDEFFDEGRKFHPESYFWWWMERKGISIDESGWETQLEKIEMRREMRAVY